MDEKKAKQPLKRIDMQAGVFTANGKTYHIEGGLSIERYAEFQILEKQLAYGYSVQGIYEELNRIKKLLNKNLFVDSVVGIVDLMRGVAKLEEREPTVLKICALFCNTDDEDRTVITDDMITAKVKDWKAEGIDMRDFFALASSSVSGLLEIYQKIARDILEAGGAKTPVGQ